jgi:hypothetical protein
MSSHRERVDSPALKRVRPPAAHWRDANRKTGDLVNSGGENIARRCTRCNSHLPPAQVTQGFFVPRWRSSTTGGRHV